jgi:phosphoserine phosphatase RsbU/P
VSDVPSGAQRAVATNASIAPDADSAEDLYEHAPCGYVSTAMDGTITRANTTLLEWLGLPRHEVVGRRFPDLLAVGGKIYYETHYAPLLRMQGSVREIAVEFVTHDGRRLPTLINSVVQHDESHNETGVRTAIFDASARRAYEEELLRARKRAETAEDEARELARALQSTLIPPDLPSMPGLAIAAAYRPAGSGDEVGGDFYDAFQLSNDSWGVAIGDIAGKGVRAAIVTSLARHTIRDAAMREASPKEILAVLNDVLYSQEDARICTAIFFRLRALEDGTVICGFSVGGHDLPVLLRRGETVVRVGALGRILGAFREPSVSDSQIVLRPGDVLLSYTDGVSEGRRGGTFFESQIDELLSTLRGETPSRTVSTLLQAAVAFQGGTTSDDIAIIALASDSTSQFASQRRV